MALIECQSHFCFTQFNENTNLKKRGHMYVKVDNNKGGLQAALRIFNRMVKKEELIQTIKNRRYYLKPSEAKAFKQKEAVRRRKREERRIARQKRYNN